MKIWNKTQINNHILAAKKLGLIKDEFSIFIEEKSAGISEKECLDFIKKSYKKHKLVNDSKKEFAIVAFGKNTKEVHYFPSSTSNSKLKTGNLILLDIWARLDKKDTPYADMTWMMYFGNKIPNEIQEKWNVLAKARNTAIEYIRKEIGKEKLPRGLDIDRISHDVIGNAGFGENIKHTIGHSLGFNHPHGKLPGINWREYSPIKKNVGYTIEPGMYFSPLQKSERKKSKNGIKKSKDFCGGNDFGMRTEIDFYISEDNKTVITTPIQKEIDVI